MFNRKRSFTTFLVASLAIMFCTACTVHAQTTQPAQVVQYDFRGLPQDFKGTIVLPGSTVNNYNTVPGQPAPPSNSGQSNQQANQQQTYSNVVDSSTPNRYDASGKGTVVVVNNTANSGGQSQLQAQSLRPVTDDNFFQSPTQQVASGQGYYYQQPIQPAAYTQYSQPYQQQYYQPAPAGNCGQQYYQQPPCDQGGGNNFGLGLNFNFGGGRNGGGRQSYCAPQRCQTPCYRPCAPSCQPRSCFGGGGRHR
jgi:hypothetical protein